MNIMALTLLRVCMIKNRFSGGFDWFYIVYRSVLYALFFLYLFCISAMGFMIVAVVPRLPLPNLLAAGIGYVILFMMGIIIFLDKIRE